MYRALLDTFVRDCVQKIAVGEPLDDASARAFHLYLDARERTGPPLLGPLAGPDGSFDTVTGRCGHRPAFCDIPRPPSPRNARTV